MSFYKYVSFEGLNRILSGSIRFTQPSAFNDPFELAFEFLIPKDYGGIPLKFEMDIKSKGELIDDYLLPYDFEDVYCNDVFSRELLSILNQSVGMLCLSKNRKSHLMWAHYAEEYSGAVIEFDEQHHFFDGCHEMNYVERRPKIHIDYFLKNKVISIAELYMKSEEWRYEQEWRLSRCLINCEKHKAGKRGFDVYVAPIPLECIKSITLGERATTENIKQIYNRIKNTNIALGLAVISNNKYEFRSEIIKMNVPASEANPCISPLTADVFKDDNSVLGEIARALIKNHPLRDIVKHRL